MTKWSEKFIQDTLDTFGPYYLKEGKILNREDAIEIIENMGRFVEMIGRIQHDSKNYEPSRLVRRLD